MKLFGEPYDSVLFQERELNPMQKQVMKTRFLDGQSLVVSAPTSSGKTLVAEMAVVSAFLRGQKSVYLSPLRALASEKYRSFKRFSSFGMKIKIATGEFDSGEVGKFDLLVTTPEKLDSLFRHGSHELDDVGLVVADEIHMIGDYSRGPTLEINLMRFAGKQIIGLSATIPNASEIAEWLGAELVISDYRPVRLDIGILYNGSLEINGATTEIGTETDLISDTIKSGKQIIVFTSSRRSAESFAVKLSSKLGLKFEESEKVLVLDPPTPQCEKLKKCLEGGVAFHHAGLHPKQRELVEKWFRERRIPVIVATPTLAMGINLPAFRVLVRDIKRFSGGYSDFLPASEIHQMLGRAGRPGLDERGEGIINAKSEAEYKYTLSGYLSSGMDRVFSKMSAEPVLRSHVLQMISDGMSSIDDIMEFMENSFFSFQYGNPSKIEQSVSRIIGDLIMWGMVEETDFGGSLSATRIGHRAAQLYIDPFSAYKIVSSAGSDEGGYLFAISTCGEMYPLLRPKKDEEYEFDMKLEMPDELIFDFEASLKTAVFLNKWINEATERQLFEEFGITPGSIYQKIRSAEWLLYSAKELFISMKRYSESKALDILMRRVRHGIKPELLSLVQIKGIGRKRARKLYNSGIKTPSEYYKAPKDRVREVLRK